MKEFDRLVEVVARLRQDCPWDRAQTHETLKPFMVEEVYEAIEAIDLKNPKLLCEELGDQLLHIVMHAEMAREKGEFTLDDVVKMITEKMIRRHPHVFGDNQDKDKKISKIWEKWEKIKQEEKGSRAQGTKASSIMNSIPKSLPALYRADKIQNRASRVGFDWDKVAGAFKKVHEEIDEVHQALRMKKSKKQKEKLKEELGDLMFSIVNVARKLKISAEEALNESTLKFGRRFGKIEEYARQKGKSIKTLGNNTLNKLWEEVKKNEQ